MKFLNNTIILILFPVVAFLCFSCKKQIFKTDLWGSVRHYYTKQPIGGISVQLSHGHGYGWFNSTEVEGVTKTDENGKFSIKLRKIRKEAYGVDLIKSRSYDSTNIEWKYITEGFNASIDKDVHPEFLLKPAGYIGFHLNDSSWSILQTDTFIIESMYAKETLIKGSGYWINFYVEPFQLNKFIWYGLKNGVKVNYMEKLIYARNFYSSESHGYWINLN